MIKYLAIFVVLTIGQIYVRAADSFNLNVLMPDVAPKTPDTYLCYKFKLDETKSTYITEFHPNSTKETAHHMLLFGCNEANEEPVWNCGEMAAENLSEKDKYKYSPVCQGGKQSIIYAWALDAPKLVLPEDVAFKVGGDTDKKYLILQVHYLKTFDDGKKDNSGVVLVAQHKPVSNTAGVYLLETGGYIDPNTEEHFEAACEMTSDRVLYPFAYRTHAHKHGIVNSGYVVKRNDYYRTEKWIELGRRSPKLPQMFYPVTNKTPIKKGDILAARCTMRNDDSETVYIGSTTKDEMCNFYLMYYVKGDNILDENICFTQGPPYWYFNQFRTFRGRKFISSVPADASDVPEDQKKELAANPNPHGAHSAVAESMKHMAGMQDENKNEHDTSSRSSEEEEDSTLFDRYEKYLRDLERENALNQLEKLLNRE